MGDGKSSSDAASPSQRRSPHDAVSLSRRGSLPTRFPSRRDSPPDVLAPSRRDRYGTLNASITQVKPVVKPKSGSRGLRPSMKPPSTRTLPRV